MKKKQFNVPAVAALVILTVIALIVAAVCRINFFAASQWDQLIFWLIFLAITLPGTFIINKLINRRK